MQTRRSMVFAKHLRLIGDDFRTKYLNSTDISDSTVYSEDWTRMKVSQPWTNCTWCSLLIVAPFTIPVTIALEDSNIKPSSLKKPPSAQAKLGSAKGGPYLGVHLRRKDFIWGHREDVPSLKGAVKKIRSLMKKHKLDKVFVATDADGGGEYTNWMGLVAQLIHIITPINCGPLITPTMNWWTLVLNLLELKELKRLLPEMVQFEPSIEDLELLKDGGVAIIDQWICAHAR